MHSSMRDFYAKTIGDEGSAKPQTVTDATDIVGAIVDTNPSGSQRLASMVCKFNTAWTAASGAAGALNTALITVYHDTASDMSTEASYGTYTAAYTWAADGANSGVFVFPLSLKTANRYVRVKARLTESGTVTVSAQTGSITCDFAGQSVSANAGYVATGYANLTEAE